MKKLLRSTIVTAGLAIFSMLFGAGNLMYPIKAGVNAGSKLGWGITGFLLTAVLIPVMGLVGIILFNGDYKAFFNRLGRIPGALIIGFCMAVIGPVYVMPRIVTSCYTMIIPFLPDFFSIGLFSIIFCGLTFLATYRESKIIDLLGNLISPALLIALSIILVKGILNPQALIENSATGISVFTEQAILGYNLLDLLGTIFFGSIVLSLLKNSISSNNDYNLKTLAWTGMQAGLLGCVLLGIVYTGMALLGAYYGQGLESTNVAELFSLISFKILGAHGAFIIATAVTMACFSTIIALSTVLAEYVQRDISNNKFSYISSLALVLGITIVISLKGLGPLLHFATPIIVTIYPLFITLTLVNLAYKLFNFKPVKIPVLITLLASLYINSASYEIYFSLFR
ncbi:branched-chain amino acid transport system II carrier protein [Candidatus Babeliales bacterium]|nr:branched-chain amino acid transport system II carrier protein [Candidatus Babeliales bacterium]